MPLTHSTPTEQLGWQRRATRVLGELLAAGSRGGLPVITWTVGGSARLVGRCLDPDMRTRRAAWTA